MYKPPCDMDGTLPQSHDIKEVFEMKRTTLVYYLQNEPKCDQL